MIGLVGYTGFVGSNIYDCSKGNIDSVYNSKNIKDSFGTNPDLLIYSGLRAEKYLANNKPEKDLESILQAEDNISRINPKKLVLISTIDVFKNPIDVDETCEIDTDGLNAYGLNRYRLEQWVRKNYPDTLIVRLPGLFGINLKKNFIYDLINVIPYMLTEKKFLELNSKDPELEKYYSLQDNGFYKVNILDNEKDTLKKKFNMLGYSALNFTDSRSEYQFYNLSRLWNDIQIALENNLLVWHPATEPVTAAEVYKYLTNKTFINELDGNPAKYNYKSIYDSLFGGSNGYICEKNVVLEEIKQFVKRTI